ncbi:hypothetical protein [Micromonospora sp. KC213]|uniref:hypothetical protein n=1 Tax=Micromonospora sp. KC213 TaxID=2530378 RepID=UPI001045BD9C|nr:hypothetical protein [Micromonospora sp. KC213]TDC44285.1 hypothetical protein E1166_00345 [Micromonospora sp. KC213]
MTRHPTLTVIDRYATADPGLDEATVWSVEVHLEDCADCRARLAGSTTPQSRALIDRVATGLDREISAGPVPAGRARQLRYRWMTVVLLPWLVMTGAVLGCAALLTILETGLPSLVLLLAPVAPLPGVAAAWSRRTDPCWELIAGTPAAGLTMVLRRTVAALVLVIPALAAVGAGTGASLALMLLPCLAFTVATLLLGTLVGVRRAAVGLAASWTLAVVLPSLATARLPVLLQADSAGLWALTTVLLAGWATTRAGSFRRLSNSN